MNSYYFDYNATTPIAPEVYKAMTPFMTASFGNPSSFYRLGREASRAIRAARQQIADLLGVEDRNQVIFTSGGTESNNAAIRGALHLSDRKEIVISSVEHPSVRNLCRQLQDGGYTVREIAVNGVGEIDLDRLRDVLSERTALVSLMLANNETGVIFPVRAVGEWARKAGAFFHVDGVQAFGRVPLSLRDWPVDFFSVSSHKIYGPKGVGALYVRNGIKMPPLILGGSQEHGLRAGTENVAGIVGFGKAASLCRAELSDEMKRISGLRDHFEQGIRSAVEDVAIHGLETDRLPNTSNLYFEGVDAESLLIALDQRDMFASRGSACMSGAQQPSYVLKAMGFSEEEINGSLRISLGRWTTGESLLDLTHALGEIVTRLRKMEKAGMSS